MEMQRRNTDRSRYRERKIFAWFPIRIKGDGWVWLEDIILIEACIEYRYLQFNEYTCSSHWSPWGEMYEIIDKKRIKK
jgi:hypothetical protein